MGGSSWVVVKRSNIIKFQSQRILYQILCVSSQKDIKHIDRTIHSVACVMHKWCDLGMLGVKNLGVEICDDAQSIARSSKQFLLFTRALL